MKAIQIIQTEETRVNFERNLLNFKRDIEKAEAKERIMVLPISNESFYVICKYEQDVNWCKAKINFHYVQSVAIIDINL